MPRFFYGNFDFEHHLAEPGYQPSAKLKRINAELATSWLAIADDGDSVWCPEPIDPAFFEQAAAQGLPRVVPISNRDDVPADVEFVPWGWDEARLKLANQQGWDFSAPGWQAARDVNSRDISWLLEQNTQTAPPGVSAVVAHSFLEGAVRKAQEVSRRVVIKAKWGMSGRERIVFYGSLTRADLAWVWDRLQSQRTVFVEPWLDRLDEIGVQLQIPQQGPIKLIGITPLHCDGLGQYRGSWFTEPPNATAEDRSHWETAESFTLKIGEFLRKFGYFGPVGFDVMRYRLPGGSIRTRLLQDINARWTMGRLALGWRRLFPQREFGFWWHGPANEIPAWPPGFIHDCEIIRTSPKRIGRTPAAHASYLLLGPA